jgi:AraC-like DNA-binding protein
MEPIYIEKALEFITEHLKDEFTLNELAEKIGYSAFHLAREFKDSVKLSIMEYTRRERILMASKDLEKGFNIYDVAMEYCFETHAGFTKAFTAIFGCTPKEFQAHYLKMKTIERSIKMSENSKLVIRHICKDDVQDLWENVYSAMTPRQITEVKILPAIEQYEKREGLELVAELDGKVVMSLPLTKPTWIPLGFVWDNNYTLTGGDRDTIMPRMMDEMKRQAKMLGISTLLSPQDKNSESSKAMQSLGFVKVIDSGDWEYLMMPL